jgi:hypothetical protein
MGYCGGEDCLGRTWWNGSSSVDLACEGLYVSLFVVYGRGMDGWGCWGGLKADECDCLSLSVLPSIVS